MTNARGDQTQMYVRRQAVFGTAEPAVDGDFMTLPIYTYDLTPQGNINEDDGIYGDSYPGDAIDGLQGATGNLVVPITMSAIGWHLSGLFGLPATTSPSANNYQHVFEAAATQVVFLHTLGKSHNDINQHFTQDSVAYSSMELQGQKGEQRARATFNMVGRQEVKALARLDNTPVSYGAEAAPVEFTGAIKLNGVLAAGITSFSATVNANVEPDQEEMNGLPTAAAINDGRWEMNGSIGARFKDTTYYDLAENGTPFDIALSYVLSPTLSLEFEWFNCRMERNGVPISGRDVLASDFNWRVNRPAPASVPFRATLINQVPDYANP